MNINELPNELLQKIFQKLDLSSKLSAETVCQRWQQLMYSDVSVEITIRADESRDIDLLKPIDSDICSTILSKFMSLKYIDIRIYENHDNMNQTIFSD